MIEIIDFIKLEAAAIAIRMCHDTVDKSDSVNGNIGELDKALIKRVGVKMKHASTLEHLRFTIGMPRILQCNINNPEDKKTLDILVYLKEFFDNNKYSKVTINNNKEYYTYIISTNMRVVSENKDKFTTDMVKLFIPKPYRYLVEEN